MRYIFATIVLLVGMAFEASAQDFLARQAPIDRAARAVDTLALQRLIDRESDETYNANFFDDWDNTLAYKNAVLPDKYTIDLRHFCMPTVSRAVTSNFGRRWNRAHKGIDVKVYVGDTIRAAFSGKVRIVKYEAKGFGRYIVIRHANGLETIYGHLSKQLVTENQEVRAGDVIGLGGNTGRSTGSHLHFETRLNGVAINPALMFDFRAQDVVGDYYVFHKDSYEKESEEANRLRGKIGNGGYTVEDVRGPGYANTPATSTQKAVATSSSEYRTHKVVKGDTLSSIAKKRGVSIDTLCRLNNITRTTKLRIGMVLRYA